MTDLNLLCTEPYLVGLLGGISFITSSIGSLTITRYIDKTGRQKALMIMSVFTPAGVLILTLLGKNLNLTAIYVVVAVMGFTYNARSSITYVFGSEFTPKAYNMRYSMAIFVTSGLLQALSGWFFWQFRSQEIYCYILVGL